MAPSFAKMGIEGHADSMGGDLDPNNCSLFLGGVVGADVCVCECVCGIASHWSAL